MSRLNRVFRRVLTRASPDGTMRGTKAKATTRQKFVTSLAEPTSYSIARIYQRMYQDVLESGSLLRYSKEPGGFPIVVARGRSSLALGF
jgi:hypothetical protein